MNPLLPRRVVRNPKRNGITKRQAPVAEPYIAPQPRFLSKTPQFPGASARYEGCDFAGATSSASAAPVSGALFALRALSSTTFPRLSAVADVFLRYRFRSLKFHFIGKSASTQAGVGAWGSFVIDTTTNTIAVNTESIIKNSEGALVLKGWESGVHEVKVEAAGQKWYNTDSDSLPFTYGDLCVYIPQTTANADLTWDVYVEYDCEFSEAVSGPTVALLREKERQRQTTSTKTEEDSEWTAVERLKDRIKSLERK